VDDVVFAADRHDAASVGFDDAVFYEYFEKGRSAAVMPVRKLALDGPGAPAVLQPFTTWQTLQSRTDY
jgi:guanine deaminase